MTQDKAQAAGAVSIDSQEFARLLLAWHDARISKPNGTDVSQHANAIIAFADAHAAQRYEAGYEAGYVAACEEDPEGWRIRAEKSEASLARLVDDIQHVVAWKRPARAHLIDSKNRTEEFVLRADLLALLPAKAEGLGQDNDVCHSPVCDERCRFPSCMGPAPAMGAAHMRPNEAFAYANNVVNERLNMASRAHLLATPSAPVSQPLDADQIEALMPDNSGNNGAFPCDTCGWIQVSAQWLHDFARNVHEATTVSLSEEEIGALEYRGNTISYIYDRAKAYGRAVGQWRLAPLSQSGAQDCEMHKNVSAPCCVVCLMEERDSLRRRAEDAGHELGLVQSHGFDQAAEILSLKEKLNGRVSAAPVSQPAAQYSQTVTMTGYQLRDALDFINPDGPGDADQCESDLTFGVRQHKDDDGKVSTGLCCWNDDMDGEVYPLDGDYTAPQPLSAPAGSDTAMLDFLPEKAEGLAYTEGWFRLKSGGSWHEADSLRGAISKAIGAPAGSEQEGEPKPGQIRVMTANGPEWQDPPAQKTPLYVEDLIEMLGNHNSFTVAGHNGSCERVLDHRGMLGLLQKKCGAA